MADATPAKPIEPVTSEKPTEAAAASSAAVPEASKEASSTNTPGLPILPLTEEAGPQATTNETSTEAPKVAEPQVGTEAPTAPIIVPLLEPTTETTTEKTAEKAAVPEAASVTEAAPATSTDGWPTLKEDHPLSKLLAELPAILKEADYNEVYGLTIGGEKNTFHTKLILQKFLRANANDLAKAKEQLLATLKWRKEYQPLKAVEETFSKDKFGGVGFITILDDVPGEASKKAVATFNLYGAVEDKKATFGDYDSFLRWRVALMELGLQKLELASAKEPLPDYNAGPDPYQGYQIHDYNNISFLKQDPDVKAASKKTIETFSKYYPETLSRKFFVNVPVIMGWMFTAMKLILAKETVRKFTVFSYGKDLAAELGPNVPANYGGKAEGLELISTGPKLE